GLSRKHVFEACHAALRRLQLETLDLYLCHRPDHETPIEETVRAMHDLITQGKVLYWGTSEWTPVQIMEAFKVAERYGLHKPQMEQPQYHMFHRDNVERDLQPLYALGLGTTIWSPLASGLLTGKYNDGLPAGTRVSLPGYEWLREIYESPRWQDRLPKVRQLTALAGELGCTTAQLALAWCLKNPQVSTVITGASRPEQVVENMQALEVVGQLTPDVMARIEEILGNKPEPAETYR
ncbi:MAG: aldo/keto reductase, partial [Chloroflexi bacterium]|nr:aldo/keto reductase [Chloroflexota bacterium]